MRVNLPITNEAHVLSDTDAIVSRSDLDGRVTYANERFVRMCGFSRDELMGNDHNLVRHPDMPREVFADLWQTVKAGKAVDRHLEELPQGRSVLLGQREHHADDRERRHRRLHVRSHGALCGREECGWRSLSKDGRGRAPRPAPRSR